MDVSTKCRACLVEGAEMKNMIEHQLQDAFFKMTNVKVNEKDNITSNICNECEAILMAFRKFRYQCQKSDMLLRNNVTKTMEKKQENLAMTTCTLDENKLTYKIVPDPSNLNDILICPHDGCQRKFQRKNKLVDHLSDHGFDNKFMKLELQYFCPLAGCIHNIDFAKNKFFTTTKLLKQHIVKVHSVRNFKCTNCLKNFPLENDLKRHNCFTTFKCQACAAEYKTNETFLVHLKRKHPDLHQYYKENKKKRLAEMSLNSKKENVQAEEILNIKRTSHTQTLDSLGFDSPKRSLATQTFEELKNKWLKNDVSLALTYSSSPTQTTFSPEIRMHNMDDLYFNSIETQTGFNSSLDSSDLFSESLTDIQTQTLDTKRNYESAETQTNENFGFKETQTCPCLNDFSDSDFANYKRSDVLLSFNSIETQTSDDF